MAAHCCIRLKSMGPRRVGHDQVTSVSLFAFMLWRRKWQPTPVFLPGESQGRGSLVGCHLWAHTESDTTEAASTAVEDMGPCNLVIWPCVLFFFLWCCTDIFSNTFLGSPSHLVLRFSAGLSGFFSLFSRELSHSWASTIESLLTFEFVS